MRRDAFVCLLALSSLLAPAALADAPLTALHDTDLMVDQVLVKGTAASAYVRVTGATSLKERHALPGAEVTLTLRQDKAEHPLGTFKTGADGSVVARFDVPALDPGRATLLVDTRSGHGGGLMTRQVTIKSDTFVRLRTDRGTYKPGSRLYWRLTVLHGVDAHPLAGAKAQVTIKDPRGTAIWRGRPALDATGMAAGDIPLGKDLVMGRYTIEAEVAGEVVRERVRVREFETPPFSVTIEPTTQLPLIPGQRVSGRVVARYPYGEPVKGKGGVGIGSAHQEFELDAFGRADFSFDVPADAERSMQLEAVVEDGARRRQRTSLEAPVRSDRVHIALVPDAKTFGKGQPHEVTVLTTDGRGRFVPADVFVKVPGAAERTKVRSEGAVRVPVTLSASGKIVASAATKDGRVARTQHPIRVVDTTGAPVLRVADSLLDAGVPVKVGGSWPTPDAPVVVSLVKAGSPVASTLAQVDAKGRLSASLVPPRGLFGLMSVRAQAVGWDPARAALLRHSAQATLFVRPDRLEVSVEGAGRFRPGAKADLAVSVLDREGNPVPGAGLAASVVDERVLSLDPAKKDIVELLEARSVEDAEQAGLRFVDLLTGEEPRDRLAARAIVDALPRSAPMPSIEIAAFDRWQRELNRIQEVRKTSYDTLVRDASAVGVRREGKWVFRRTLDDVLASAGWADDKRQTPWRRALDWRYAQTLDPSYTFEAVARRMAADRLQELAVRLRDKRRRTRKRLHRPGRTETLQTFAKGGVVEPWMVTDPWGREVRVQRLDSPALPRPKPYISLVSRGPDGKLGTSDDIRYDDVYDEGANGSGGLGMVGYGAGGGGFAMAGRRMARPRVMLGAAGAKGQVAVRKRFDETVLWVAGVRTDANGRAPLEVSLADSVTGWSVEVEAVSQRGAVGVAKTRLETFLPMYADAQVPRELTVGDRYELPVVLANHTQDTRRMEAHLQVAGSVVLEGPEVRALELPAGTTGVVAFPIRARSAGQSSVSLRVREGERDVDASERVIAVAAAGRRDRALYTGRVEDGIWSADVAIPKAAAEGTISGAVRIYRGAVDQATDGLEGMLREPHGCFEQTSSSTYPNLLVLELLGGDEADPAVISRATDLVARGYQRLISYEVNGGGFSWFGQAPANQVLTAYGLMEFVDMARVYPVDPNLIDRTRKWLLAKQKSDGSWAPDASWLHDWSAVQGKVSTTAWIAWALAESGYEGRALDKAFRYLKRHRASLAKDPYLLSLWAAAETRAGNPGAAPMRALEAYRASSDKGTWFGAGGKTLFYTSGTGADVQVTALAAMAHQRAKGRDTVDGALQWLWSTRSPNYGWGSTQGTVLALRAAALNAAGGEIPSEGTLQVKLDGKPIGTLDLASEGIPTVRLPATVQPGSHKLSVEGEIPGLMTDLRLAWREGQAPAAVEQGLRVGLKTPDHDVRVGRTGAFEVRVENPSKEAIPMPTLVIPVPPGWRVDARQLKQAVQRGQIERFEDQGSAIFVYLSKLAAGEVQRIAYELEATAVCEVTQRGPRAYAYYDTTVRGAASHARVRTLPR